MEMVHVNHSSEDSKMEFADRPSPSKDEGYNEKKIVAVAVSDLDGP